MAAGVSHARQREVKENRWRNPALDEKARRKLSRPRKHIDDPVLHSAIEKLGAGVSVPDLTPEEQEAHRAYRRRLRQARADEARAYYRRRYWEQMATEKGRDRAREQWKQQRERLAQREPNRRLIKARQAVGLSQGSLAEAVGVSQGAVSKWERFSTVPRSEGVRRRVEELLGKVWGIATTRKGATTR
jgi:DNA-binding transcriptional regulator YiaG